MANSRAAAHKTKTLSNKPVETVGKNSSIARWIKTQNMMFHPDMYNKSARKLVG